MLGNLLISQANANANKVFEVKPIPKSFEDYYEDSKDEYLHWCGKIGSTLPKDKEEAVALKDDEFRWFGDYTGHLRSEVGGDNSK